MSEFGRLTKLDPRTGWRYEDADFTPWLGEAENLDLLGKTVALDLELIAREHRVGPYRADLLCRNTDDDSLVVIENQFGASDHKHLGQLLTYAAGLQAATVIWVAPEFTDEHQAAVNWLNEHTGDDVRFFALEIELWRIGDSAMAPKFNIAARPNEWVKAGTTARQGDLSPHRSDQQAYWEAFKQYAQDKGSSLFIDSRSYPQGWIVCKPYASSRAISAAVMNTKSGSLRAEVYFKGDMAKPIFDWLHEQKDSIEERLGMRLTWERLDQKTATRIKVEVGDIDWRNENDHERQFDWMLANTERLVPVFKPLIAEWLADHREE